MEDIEYDKLVSSNSIEADIEAAIDEMTGTGAVASVDRPIGTHVKYGKCTDKDKRKRKKKR